MRLITCVLCLAFFSVPVYADTIRIGYLLSDSKTQSVVDAYQALLDTNVELRDTVSLGLVSQATVEDVDPNEIADVDVLVLDIHEERALGMFNETYEMDLISEVTARGTVLAVGEGLFPKEQFVEQGAVWDERLNEFWQHGGPSNTLGALKLALGRAGVEGLGIPELELSLDFGYYYADGDGGRVFSSWETFDEWRQQNGKARSGAPRVAVSFYSSSYYTADTAVIDAVIAEIERQGAEAVPLFGYPDEVAYDLLLRDQTGAARADVALAFSFRFASPSTAETLTGVDIPILSLTTLYDTSEEEWRESRTGLTVFEGTFQVAAPELGGLIAPTIVGSREIMTDDTTGLTVTAKSPIEERVRTAVQRALRYAELRETPNAEKHLALIYYNYPPGKANIGASYLNVAESLANVLTQLRAEGYDVGSADITADSVLEDITTKARNVGGYAPGELAEMLAAGNAVRVSAARYKEWLDTLTPHLRDKVIADWGDPADVELMAESGPDGPSLVIPLVRYGNIVVMPQPARGWGEDHEQLYHAKDLAPHHQYVAAYMWLRNEFAADAVVHVGTHGTLEWLDGKDVGLSADDAPDAMIGDLPNLYIYNVDVVGEGLVARRRGAAALVDHMVPPFTRGGLYGDIAILSERIDDYHGNEHKNPELAALYADEIRERVIDLGIAKDLGLDLPEGEAIDHDVIHEIQDQLVTLKSQNIPYGLHAFGRVPPAEHIDSTIDAIVSTDRSLLPDARQTLSRDMADRIVESGSRELDNLMRGLSGRYLPGGNGGDPIRNPDAYPTGKNFFGIDPEKVPKKASWELGVQLADQMLQAHLAEHGRYPEKISFVIWGGETMRHEGVIESQIFHLLGTRPVWDARDKVVDVEVIPRAELGRPRVDIVIASAAEGMFGNVTMLMDKAVQLAKVMDEADNYVRQHYLSTRTALIELGYSEEDADSRAGVRIFDEPPGTYNLNTARIVEASGTWETDAGIANDYMKKMGHGFGNGFWGEPMEDVFRLALSGTEKVVHSSSTSLYGALDNDDFYMYMGGLATAIRNLDGETPDLVVTNTRDPGRPEMTSIDEFIGLEFRSRYVNPTWIEGMMSEGYAGAGEMRKFVEYLWGWDVTATDTVDDAMWNEAFEVYVQDKHELDIEAFFNAESPFAYQDLTARMIETIRKEYWQADESTRSQLLREYIDSVNEHGAACTDHTCGNPRFLDYVVQESLAAGVPAPLVENFRQTIEQMTGRGIVELKAEADAFVTENEARVAARQEALAAGRVPDTVRGYVMETIEQTTQQTVSPVTRSGVRDSYLAALLTGALLLVGLLVWRRRYRVVTS